MVGRKLIQEQVRIAIDHGQKIIEIVSDSTGQPPDRFDLRRLLKLGFHRFVFGNVLLGGDEVGHFALLIPNRGDVHLLGVKSAAPCAG